MDQSIQKGKEWYTTWFDSPYYHLLYRRRNLAEAQSFINRLTKVIQAKSGDRVLDVACGKGRHSIFLHRAGLEVTGIDLSANNIAHARQFETSGLSFVCHDMRKPFRTAYFDFVFNVFTSFGYFEYDSEDLNAVLSMRDNLKENGLLVLDFLNLPFVQKNLPMRETRNEGGIAFNIHKFYDGRFINKNISFTDDGHHFSFTERVKGLTLADFERHFTTAGLAIENLFGDYQLSAYQKASSERLIILARKQ